jgi:tetratricopeptide (TPR) repeat protein
MSLVSRVNRALASGALTLVALALALPAAALAQAIATPGVATQGPTSLLPQEQYDACMSLAHSDPVRALDQATTWRNLGGGFAADHCAAVALIGQKRYAEAATKLQTMAGAMMNADQGLRGGAMEQAGSAWLLDGKPDEAKADFDAALAFLPNDPEILIDRAEAYALQKKFFEAIDDLNRALDLAPNRADALTYRASAYRQLNSLDLALDDVERALSLLPNSTTALLERGNIRRLKGDFAGAKADWQRIDALAPGTSEDQAAKDNLARLASDPVAQNATGAAATQATSRP